MQLKKEKKEKKEEKKANKTNKTSKTTKRNSNAPSGPEPAVVPPQVPVPVHIPQSAAAQAPVLVPTPATDPADVNLSEAYVSPTQAKLYSQITSKCTLFDSTEH